MRPTDKSSFYPRRPLESIISTDKNSEKKKLDIGKFLKVKKFKPTISKPNILPKVLIATKRRAVISAAVLVVLVGGIGFGYYQYLLSQNPAVIYAKKLQTITQQVSHQVTLPTDEKPVIATVSDTTVLPKETFFQNAQDGDKILLYKKHKKAILYRPTSGQVITVAVLDFRDIKPTSAPAVAGASTSANTTVLPVTIIGVTSGPIAPTSAFVPQGKILVRPQ